ncbi:MAG: right-handed parallel beta-helix repeat-containing protein [Bacillota bacterium]|nr:right-handed parallel beta-helix repeat-containing protein [Bacillota bacterium]
MIAKKSAWKAVTLVIFTGILLILMSVPAEGEEQYLLVGDGGYATIEEAIEAAADGDKIQISAGNYPLPQINLDKSISLSAAEDSSVTIVPINDTGTNRNWIYVEADHSVQMTGLIFDGKGTKIDRVIYADGSLTIENCAFQNIVYKLGKGRAITLHGDQSIVKHCQFCNIGELGIYIDRASGCVLESNAYRGKGIGEKLDYGFKIGGGSEVTLCGNCIQYCQGIVEPKRSAGIWIIDNCGQPIVINIEDHNQIDNNLTGFNIDLQNTPDHHITIYGNKIEQNNTAIETNDIIDATGNYWGGDAPPPTNHPNCVSDTVCYCPWAQDTVDADQDGDYDHLVKSVLLSWANGTTEDQHFDLQNIQAGETIDLKLLARTIDRAPNQENVVIIFQWTREGGLQSTDIRVNGTPLNGTQYQTSPLTITDISMQYTIPLQFNRSGSYSLQIKLVDDS